MNAPRVAAFAAACLAVLCQPGSAQAPDPLTLFPAWSEQVASLNLRGTGLFEPSASLRTSGSRCVAAGAVGFALGTVGDVAWSDPVGKLVAGLPGTRVQSPVGNRRLADFGALFAKALVCPRPLARWAGAPSGPQPGTPRAAGPVR